MDLKKKLDDTKQKLKQHAPEIVAGLATVAIVVLSLENHRLKKQLSSRCGHPSDETHVFVTFDAIQRLKDGQAADFEPISDDLRLTLHKLDPDNHC